ncbi:MAG: 3-oxoacyl-ACP synthase III [Planctomycetota bacterium]
MKYQRVFLEAIGYELAPVVVTSAELEVRLAPLYRKLHLAPGQLEFLTGIAERRWWEEDFSLSTGAARAARRALERSPLQAQDIDVIIYAGVCREDFEPATACRVAAELGLSPATIYDLSNACLGVMNGVLEIANRIELGHIRAGLVVSCESAREIQEIAVEQMLADGSMECFSESLATLTGGSGAAAVVISNGSFGSGQRPRLLSGIAKSAPQYHHLSRWGLRREPSGAYRQYMVTRSADVLQHGVQLGVETWAAFLAELGWSAASIDGVICHQVGSGHRDSILEALQIPEEKDFSSYEFLGNMGTVSLPLTAALAEGREFLRPGHQVGFLGIGSGLNCLMLGWQW